MQPNLLSTVAAVSGWKQSSWVGCSTVSAAVWSTARAETQTLKVICQPSFLFHPAVSRWVSRVVFSNEWFQSGWAQRARWDALWEKREASGQPTILWDRAIISHKVEPSETEHSLTVCHVFLLFFFFFALIFSVRYLLIWFVPVGFGLCTGLMQWLFEACG